MWRASIPACSGDREFFRDQYLAGSGAASRWCRLVIATLAVMYDHSASGRPETCLGGAGR
jgi:hypothetical protein